VSVVVQSRMNALGIQSPRGGPHSIRHSFATQLLNIGRPYKEIADILGHQTSTSVSIYAKPSVQRLREVSDLDLVGAL
jgi:integrase/recombinase XerD